ncbi:AAA family ATPase [Rufibacter quisquiliarum]|uniref:Putative ATPase n=1 Tax=Rufibacter quisquiliarum TaxID=1549639 RepID=A0A839GK91_9BACT|nr:AAA family ATPase [Rufibacter quisquiliarum]MBA9077209.1 putative ATPase [Rufibacter quisquiliarum]
MFKLTLNNFRGFKSEIFDFSRLNILIGENSSGKSSVLKFLLALKQSFSRTNLQNFNLTLSDDYVDLGDYSEMISEHDISKSLCFTFSFNNYYEFFTSIYLSPLFNVGEEEINDKDVVERRGKLQSLILSYLPKNTSSNIDISIELTSDLENHKSIIMSIECEDIGKINIIYPENYKPIEQFLSGYPKCLIQFWDIKGNLIEIPDVEYEKKAFLSIIRVASFREELKKVLESDEFFSRSFWQPAYLLVVQNYLEFIIDKIEFVNPIHSKPERFYFDKDKKSVYKTNDIAKLVDLISKKNFPPEFIEDFYKVVADYGIAQGLDITVDNKLPVKELRVKINNLWNNITDVGYGVSLQLPIIFQAFLAENGNEKKILLIEQPEVHLHPRLQAKFIETLVKLGQNNMYFIETHSEYIVRKLQILVKEKSYGLSSSDVSISYLRTVIEDERSKSVKSNHLISENGRLVPPLPSSFFDNSYELAKGLLD